jgi:hypothetical protein
MKAEDFSIEDFDMAYKKLEEEGVISTGFYRRVIGFTPEQKKVWMDELIKQQYQEMKTNFLNSLFQ